MIVLLLLAALVTGLFVVLGELAAPYLFPRASNGRRPHPTVGLGLVLALLVFSLVDMAALVGYPPNTFGPRVALPWALAGAVVLLLVGLRSDYSKPRSRNHLLGTLIAGFLCFLGGFAFSHSKLPFLGPVELGLLAGCLLTLLWVFLVVSMVELCSLLPLAAGAISFLVGASILLPLDAWRTPEGILLCGALMGSAVGRLVGMMLVVRSDPHEKADILVMGHLVACAVLATFLKSVTVAALILPVGFIATLFVLVGLQSFDRLTILRETPRNP